MTSHQNKDYATMLDCYLVPYSASARWSPSREWISSAFGQR